MSTELDVTAATLSDPAGDRRRRDGSPPGAERLFRAGLVVAVLPIVVAVVGAGADRWQAIQDNGYFLVRSRDVLTGHHPLLGTWTSASLSSGRNINNPGPLLFDLLALPSKLFDGSIGVAVGAALINIAAVIGIGVVARRRGGAELGIAALAVATTLCWSMGSELLFDPWQPNSLLLPFLLLLFLCWSLLCGDLPLLPWAVAVASLVIQTHLSYAVLLVALGGWSGLGLVLHVRRRRREDPDGWEALRRRLGRAVLAAGVVGALCWAQPVAEQLANGREGNLLRLAGNMASAPEQVGPDLGIRAFASVVVAPPFWFRPSFGESMIADPADPDQLPPAFDSEIDWVGPPTQVAAALVLALGLLVAAAVRDARRRTDRVSASVLSCALVAAGAALATLVALPFGVFGLPAHQMRWLWPVAAFLTFALAVFALRRWDRRSWAPPVLAGLTVVVAGLNLVEHNATSGPSEFTAVMETVQQMNVQMVALEGQGPLLLDLSRSRFLEPYSGAVMAELQRRGITFFVDDEVQVRQLGEARRLTGPAPRLEIFEGDFAVEGPPGATRVVFVPGLAPNEQRRLEQLRRQLGRHLRDLGRVPLNERGEAALTRPDRVDSAAAVAEHDVGALFASRTIDYLVENDLLTTGSPWDARFRRYAELQRRWDIETVGLFLSPFDDGSAG